MIRKVATKLTDVKKALPGADLAFAFAIGPLIGRVRTLFSTA
jgi:hypothetical protein